MTTGAGASDLLHAEDAPVDDILAAGEEQIVARSPLQLFWRRLRRDKVAIAALVFIGLLVFVAIFAAPITSLVGVPPPNVQSTAALDEFGLPRGRAASIRSASTRSAATSSPARSTGRGCR